MNNNYIWDSGGQMASIDVALPIDSIAEVELHLMIVWANPFGRQDTLLLEECNSIFLSAWQVENLYSKQQTIERSTKIEKQKKKSKNFTGTR